MTAVGVDDIKVLIAGHDLSGDLVGLSAGVSAVTEQVNGFGDSWIEEAYVGIARSEASVNGYYDDATTDPALVELQGTDRVCCLLWGLTAGDPFFGMTGVQGNYARSAAREELGKVAASLSGNGQADDGETVQPLAAESGAGVTSAGSLDNAASSANGGAVYLQVTALTLGGYTSITVTVEDSPNDSTWATLATFTVVTASPTAERVAVSGTIDRYVRVTLTLNGTGSGESITLMAGLARS